jgi:sec-independent protein translocase protein TatC
MSLLDHLEELRLRLTRMIVAAIAGFVACYAFHHEILDAMLRPLKMVLPQNSTIQATDLTEAFFINMKAAFVAGIFVVSPYLFYQIWSFIAPGLYSEERKLAVPVAFFTALCFVSGACFGYFVVFPYGFTFLAHYDADIVTLNPKLSEYYSMALGLLFAFGIIFEMPVFIFFLARFGIVNHKWLRAQRRWAIVIIFIVAAVVCPNPDVVSMMLMAVPMVVLYEVSIWVAYFFGKERRKPGDNLPAAPGDGGGGAPGGASGTAPETGPPSGPEDGPQPGCSASGAGGCGGPAAVDSALEEAHASETPGQKAEREAHDTAALGHDPEHTGHGEKK